MARRFSPPKQPPSAGVSSPASSHSSANRIPNELFPPPANGFASSPLPPTSSDEAKKIDQSQPPPIIVPPDLVAEILIRLPVRSLVRFRCVSKSFETLISSTGFVKAHLANTKSLASTEPIQVQRLMLEETMSLHSYSLKSLHSNNHQPRFEIDCFRPQYLPVPVTANSHWIAGSCDGIFCSVIGWTAGYIVLWNPSTGACATLPDFGPGEPWNFFGFGFGYDRQLDDYKVVVLYESKEIGYGGATDQTLVQVCALKSVNKREFVSGKPW